MTAQDHNKLLSIFFLVQGLLQIFGVIVAALIVGGMGVYIVQRPNTPESIGFIIGSIIGVVVAAVLLILPPLLAALGMFKRKTWAKTAGIIAAIISLLSFPLGTALGVYALWFLFSEDAKQFYLTGGSAINYMTPPPPQNWR